MRRYRIAKGGIGELVYPVVGTNLAERMAELEGFIASLVFSGDAGELVSFSVFRDQASATASNGSRSVAAARPTTAWTSGIVP